MKEIGFITKDDCYLFGQGTHYELYKKLGAHPFRYRKCDGWYFAVWAPHARKVSVTGDFNGWDVKANPCRKLSDSGIWECFVKNASVGERYKFAVTTAAGKLLYKADPFARTAERRPDTASLLAAEPWEYEWKDAEWMDRRRGTDPRRKPLSIYECHLGSWRKPDGSDPDSFYSYRKLARLLADYVKKTGYTHIELIGISEYPYDGSWGYQVTGYYAPTSRYGSNADFQYFVDYMHRKGIGVILDWVPAHFPKDEHGLAAFDGKPLYEYADWRGSHPQWGTLVFDYGKTEVRNFLMASALNWLNEYHIDGLRVDAVASMLYLDFGREAGEWQPNENGGNENPDAVEFFRHLNSVIAGRGDGTMIIAEESTTWPMVTRPVEHGGLGFTFKWNMGWMHDFLEYMKLDPYFKSGAHNMMTFAMTYATTENFVLVLSHDEVVHLKCSMLSKMPGIYEDKFANLKCAYAFMIMHPGKKLLFMGQDFGQWHEWDEKVQLSWELMDNPLHADLNAFFAKLLTVYRKHPCLYEMDDMWDGFEWINADDCSRSIYSWIRRGTTRKKSLIFAVNFTPVAYPDFRLGVPAKGTYRLLLSEKSETGSLKAEKGLCDSRPYYLKFAMPAYGIRIFEK